VGNANANLIIDQGTGTNTLVGLAGADTLVAGSGDDILFGGNPTFNLGSLAAPAGVSLDSNGISAYLADGSVLIAGTDSNANQVLVHYLKSGLQDTAFGTGGLVTAPAGTNYSELLPLASGKILLMGSNNGGGMMEMGSPNIVTQLTSTGAFDTTFGTGGNLLLPAALSSNPIIALLYDGSFLVGGTDINQGSYVVDGVLMGYKSLISNEEQIFKRCARF
jgi:hypothetical protein